ncbi:apolipoprotein A1/A4/E family protein [Epibacterium ulvae]|uniref:apolipoprotein A1/A4/E family protein n=1 Tax=Epibacterium ulvae TaxID=1156985 RepID=UPI001BFC6228|nr:apolipoprotein A1/A4/E family protein [Epibacterium ulvae]MBT8153918.1 apolipoprotein A1/A4/E family protein [Epibacterium ulvae]
MSGFKVEGLEIKKLLKVAKKQPISFSYNPGKGGDDQYFGLDRRKPPKMLGQEAKKEGDGAKFAFGTATLEGKVLTLKCDKLIPALAKTLKKYLRKQKVPLNVQIMDATGTVVDSDISDDIPDDPEFADAPAAEVKDTPASAPKEEAPEAREEEAKQKTSEPEAKPDEDPKKKVMKKLAATKAELQAQSKPIDKKLVQAFEKVVEALKAGKVEVADAIADKIAKAVADSKAKAPPPPPPPPGDGPDPAPEVDEDALRERLKVAFAALQDDYKAFMVRGDKSLTGKAKQLHDAFGATIDSDLAKAGKIVSTLKKFVEAQLAALPPISAADKAKLAVQAAQGQPAPAERYAKSGSIQAKYPGASGAAKDVMDGFAAVLGDQEITPELMAEAQKGIEQAEQRLKDAEARLKKAQDMGDGPNKAEAIRLAQLDVDGMKDRVTGAKDFVKAARGKKALTAALTYGPLSANSGQSFSDEAAKALIEGFARDPDLTQVAVEAASSGKYPDAVAQGLTKVMDQRDTGFKDASGKAFSKPETAEKYAEDLLKMGADVGPEFFGRMDDYMASGRQHKRNPLGDARIANDTAKAQKRSVALGGALLKDGALDLNSQDAKDTVGDMLFSPYSLRNPMPAMNEHVVKTLDFLGDPANAAKANDILDDIPDTNTKSSRKLVRKALGKRSSEAVDKGDAQQAVMASMLKPLDQGPVGSCFATAPARRLRETEPLKAMDAYASIAGEGKYKPPFGPEVAAVTNLPKHEDPLMRSWEYSLATSMSRKEGSDRADTLGKVMDRGMEDLSDELNEILLDKADDEGVVKGLFTKLKKKFVGLFKTDKLREAIKGAFQFTYDPTSEITDSSDGSSSTGRFIMVRKSNGNEIRTRADFAREVSSVAIEFLNLDPTSDAADDVRDYVGSDAFIDKVTPGTGKNQYLPWQQSSGGQTGEATRTLFGDDLNQEQMSAEVTGAIDMGDRTEEVLTSMLDNFTGSPEEMVTIRTVGMHGFNALPNDPSLDKLKGKDKAEIEANVKAHLLDAGKALKDMNIDEGRAQYLFDKQIAEHRKELTDANLIGLLDAGAVAHRPTGADITPAKLAKAVDDAVEDYIDEKAKGYTDVAAAAAWFKNKAAGGAKSDMMKDLGAPEFVIADSNWGSAEDHTFFVVSPDPTTGEPQLWMKTVPPGSLRPATDDWAKAEWAAIQ